MATKKNLRKIAFLEALRNHLGNVTASCAEIGISRQSYYEWLNNDPEFKASVEGIGEGLLDMAENALLAKIESGDTTATIFYLKTKGKKRGYIEKQETQLTIEPEYTMKDPNE